MPASRGARKPPTLLEAVQKPQKVPRSLPANQAVRKRAHAGAPSPYTPQDEDIVNSLRAALNGGTGDAVKPGSQEASMSLHTHHIMHSERCVAIQQVKCSEFHTLLICSSKACSQPCVQASQGYRAGKPSSQQGCHAKYMPTYVDYMQTTWQLCVKCIFISKGCIPPG